MADQQKHPIKNQADSIVTGSGSHGTFICSPTSPFDYSALTGLDKGKMGHAIQFFTLDGSSVEVATVTLNGVIGDADFLNGATIASGQGFAFEVETMTLTSGYCQILLKETSEK